MSTLSVDTSSNASSTATESPTFFNQRVTVPSETLSPSAGMVMTVPAPEAAGAAGATCAGGGVTGAAGATGVGASATGAATGAAAGAGVDATAPSAIIASSAPTGTV